MGEGECAEWEKLAAEADSEAAIYQPTAAAISTIRQALDLARERLGGEDVGAHHIPFSPNDWQLVGVSLLIRCWPRKRSGGRTALTPESRQ